MEELLGGIFTVWLIVGLLAKGGSRVRRWFMEIGWRGTPTFLVVRGRPVFITQSVFQRAIDGAYADSAERGRARFQAYMVSSHGSETQQRIWKRIRQWLECQHDASPELFEAEWVAFQLSGEDARRDCHDLMFAWSTFSKIGEAVAGQGSIGVASKRTHRVCATVISESVIEASGSLEGFTLRTAGGSCIQASRGHFRVLAK